MPRIPISPLTGSPGTYNQVWFDRGTQIVSTRRTSLIVDPPDGRIPWRPEARKHYERFRARYGVGPYESAGRAKDLAALPTLRTLLEASESGEKIDPEQE